jgi:hypothetical protein
VVRKMTEKIPKRKISKFKIGKEQTDELKTISAITKVLAEQPQLANELAEIFVEVEMEKQRKLTEKVSKLLADNLKEFPIQKISASFDQWCPLFARYVDAVRYTSPRYRYSALSPDRYRSPR